MTSSRLFKQAEEKPLPLTPTQVSVGLYDNIFLNWDRTVICNGLNTENKFGFPDERRKISSERSPTLTQIKKILAASDNGYFFEKSDGSIWVSGGWISGQLGLKDKVVTLPFSKENADKYQKQIEVAHTNTPVCIPGLKSKDIKSLVTNQNSFILLNSGEVLACGRNEDGQLGLGHTKPIAEFTQIPELKGVSRVINSNVFRTYFLMQNGTVQACGNNVHGQLGVGSEQQIYSTPTKIPHLSEIFDVYCKESFKTFFLKKNGRVYGCGNNYFACGLLGSDPHKIYSSPALIKTLTNINSIIEVWNGNLFLTHDGNVFLAITDNYGRIDSIGVGVNYLKEHQLTKISELKNIVRIASIPLSHTLALTKDGQVFAFGYNEFGQLGLGHCDPCGKPTLIPEVNDAVEIYVGYEYSMIRRNNGAMLGFGRNHVKQLGTLEGDHISSPQVMTHSPPVEKLYKKLMSFQIHS